MRNILQPHQSYRLSAALLFTCGMFMPALAYDPNTGIENFEGPFPGQYWFVGDDNSAQGFDFWDDESCTSTPGSPNESAWCAGSGSQSCSGGDFAYDSRMDAFMYVEAEYTGKSFGGSNLFSFWWWGHTFDGDFAQVRFEGYVNEPLHGKDNANCTPDVIANFTKLENSGHCLGGHRNICWIQETYMLPPNFDSMNFVRVIFKFHSDGSVQGEGVYIDEIEFNGRSNFNIYPIDEGFDGCCSSGDCNDGNPCTTDSCTNGSCQITNNSISCNDGLFCNGSDTCNNGSCSVHAGDPCPGPDGDNNCAETCNETADDCSAFDPSGSACENDRNECTNDVCSSSIRFGASCTHPFVGNGVPCGDDTDTMCDNPDTCRQVCIGFPQQCFPPVCQDNLASSSTECRSAVDDCDEPEFCTSGICPSDGVKASGTVCRDSFGSCDFEDTCDGSTKACPSDAVQPNSTICRTATGECDVAETCDGVGTDCPSDAFMSSGSTCTDDGDNCTLDQCDSSGDCIHSSEPECCPVENECCVDGDCNDENSCTTDTCVDNTCDNTAIIPCCGDGDCDNQSEDSCLCEADCGSPPNSESGADCNDELDNDCDGDVDEADSDCEGSCTDDLQCDDNDICTADACVNNQCTNTASAQCCGDGVCDLDSGEFCTCPDDCGSPPSSETSATCDDGIDNDCDGDVDEADSDCVPMDCTDDDECDDGDSCTRNDCENGVCQNPSIQCPNGQTCIEGICEAVEPEQPQDVPDTGTTMCGTCGSGGMAMVFFIMVGLLGFRWHANRRHRL